MFERLTSGLRFTVVAAQEATSELDDDWLGTEHLLLALLHDPDSVNALAHVGQRRNTVRAAVIAGRSPRPARRENRDFIEFTDHGLLKIDGRARQALRALGVDLDQLRQIILDTVSHQPDTASDRPVNR